MDRLLNVTTGLSVILLVMVLVSVRRAHIRVEYSVSWLLAAAAMLILSRAHPLLNAVRNLIGLPDSPLTLFLLAGGVFLIMFFRFSVIISHLRDDNIALAQRVAILEYHLQNLRDHENQEAKIRPGGGPRHAHLVVVRSGVGYGRRGLLGLRPGHAHGISVRRHHTALCATHGVATAFFVDRPGAPGINVQLLGQ